MATRAVTWAKACLKAVANINGPIRDLLLGKDPLDQKRSTTR
jgi:enolase